MSKLSPAAQAVLDAANGAQCYGPDDCLNESRWIAAAALRAAADEVIPSAALRIGGYDEYAQGSLAAQLKYRDKLLEIIAELEAQ